MNTLTCNRCKREWERPRDSGSFPVDCPDCEAWCDAGESLDGLCLYCGEGVAGALGFCRARICQNAKGRAAVRRNPACTVKGCPRNQINKRMGLCGPCYTRWHRENGPKKSYECVVCGETFERSRKPQGEPCCSPDCQRKLGARGRAAIAGVLAAEKRAKRYVPVPIYKFGWIIQVRKTPHIKGTYKWKGCVCDVCGETFIDIYYSVVCSEACRAVREKDKRREYKLARNERLKGAYVERVYTRKLIERDGRICGICRFPIPEELEYPHPLALTVDHIVPLNCGGEHSMKNTQPAHYICNSYKGDRMDCVPMTPDELLQLADDYELTAPRC